MRTQTFLFSVIIVVTVGDRVLMVLKVVLILLKMLLMLLEYPIFSGVTQCRR